jgi:hypothetical protein
MIAVRAATAEVRASLEVLSTLVVILLATPVLSGLLFVLVLNATTVIDPPRWNLPRWWLDPSVSSRLWLSDISKRCLNP